MITRVTHHTVQQSTLANLQLNLSRMADLQARLSSGKNIGKPSDDPAGTAQTLQLRAERRAAEQAARNADDANSWLTVVDSALQTSVTTLRKARDLVVQGATSMGPTAREAIAVELEGLRDALLAQANTTYLGRSVFAGTSDAGAAFTDPGGGYAWEGTDDATVDRRLAPSTTVRVDVDGRAAFGEGAGSVFALIDAVAADLRAGVDIRPRLDEIDVHMNNMLAELGSVGARHKQVLTAQEAIQKQLRDLDGSISAIEDIDIARTIVELQSQEVAYQAALGATARVLQPSLMDFLR